MPAPDVLLNNRLIITDQKGKEYMLTNLQEVQNFGCGGSKCAYKLTDDTALIVPNRGGPWWDMMVENEVKMSEFLSSVGLLNPKHERVTITVISNTNQPILKMPAYISKSFESLQKIGIQIIDLKQYTKIIHNGVFYDHSIDLYNMDNWNDTLMPLINDLNIIQRNHIPASGDSVNFALIYNPGNSMTSPLQMRYFGFDFTSKGEKAIQLTNDWIDTYAILRRAIEYLLFMELDIRYNKPTIYMNEKDKELMNLIYNHFSKSLL